MRLNNSTYLGGVLERYDLDAYISTGKNAVFTLLESKICLSVPSEEHSALAC